MGTDKKTKPETDKRGRERESILVGTGRQSLRQTKEREGGRERKYT